MYDTSRLQTALDKPTLALRELNSLYHSRFGLRDANPKGVNFFTSDWDNLIILDACRYDTFQRCISDFDIQGQLRARHTYGTNTAEFLRPNLHNHDFSDTVYVTASSMLYRESVIESNIVPHLFDIIDVWQNNSSDETNSVPPEVITERAIRVLESHPSKRLAIHYIQPHTPFVGEYGQSHFEPGEHAMWNEKLTGECEISDETIWAAYRENLRLVLGEVSELVNELPGKTIVTSDHGQAIGDRAWPIPYPEYGHPSGIYIEPLTKVPWFVCVGDDRRKITEGDSQPGYPEKSSEKDKEVLDQLEALGYR